MANFLQTLAQQRYDDHRYYHHSRINQSLHLVSALSFLASYVLLFVEPAYAALLAWCVAMTTRQSGHFFFEPRGYDEVNQATDAYKEEIKVGYNIRRKVALLVVWVALPVLFWLQPSLFGFIEPHVGWSGFVHDVGIAWLALGLAGLLYRGLQLFVRQDATTSIAWMTKICTDPFHDVMLYWRSPFALLRGEWIDPMRHLRADHAAQPEALAQHLGQETAADAPRR